MLLVKSSCHNIKNPWKKRYSVWYIKKNNGQPIHRTCKINNWWFNRLTSSDTDWSINWSCYSFSSFLFNCCFSYDKCIFFIFIQLCIYFTVEEEKNYINLRNATNENRHHPKKNAHAILLNMKCVFFSDICLSSLLVFFLRWHRCQWCGGTRTWIFNAVAIIKSKVNEIPYRRSEQRRKEETKLRH